MKPALLVIDVQKEFFTGDPATAQSLNEAIPYINASIALFREKGLPVIAIQHMNVKEGLVPGCAGFDLPEALCIEPTDLHIHKTYGNSFNKTSLEADLRAQGVDTVIVTGFCAEYCVLAAYRGAEDRDFSPLLLKDAIASGSAEHIRFVEEICDGVSLRALKKMLAG